MDTAFEPLWDGLHALADREPAPLAAPTGDATLGELAAATPYLRRLAAVHAAASRRGVPVEEACRWAREAASMRRHRRGVLTEQDVLAVLLGAAVDARLFDVDDRARRLHPGQEAALVLGHPLAAWGETLPLIVYGDPLAGDGGPTETVALLTLLYQYVVRSLDADLEPCVRAVWRELVDRAGDRGGRHPSQRAVRRQLASLVALLEELGVVVWEPAGSRLGIARATSLGRFGWLLLVVEREGPSPALEQLLQEHGYLPADGGYVHRGDLPVTISDN